MEHRFPSGIPALDFTGTLRMRRSIRPLEMLDSPESLIAWLRACWLADAELECGPSDVAEAVVLREAIYQLVLTRIAGDPYPQDALRLVNDTARHEPPTVQLTATGRRVEATMQQAFSHIARDAIAVLSDPGVPLLKECANPECTQFYVDRSRGARREWCRMDPCGNRIKAAAYRARKRKNEQATTPAHVRS